MSNSIEEISTKQQRYTYTPPSPPSNLIDSTTLVIDFTDRKFLNVGLDPAQNFNVMVQIITSSRHVVISPEFLNRIFSLMGNILSFILDPPQTTKKINNFLETEAILLSSMVYKGQNQLVIQSKVKNGCRILLNRQDLLTLQQLEWCIFESTVRKSTIVRPRVLQQLEKIADNLNNEFSRGKNPILEDRSVFVKSLQDDRIQIEIPNGQQNHTSQLKLFAAEQLAQRWIMLEQSRDIKPFDVNDGVANYCPDENDGPIIFNVYNSTLHSQSEPNLNKLPPLMETTIRSKSEPSISPSTYNLLPSYQQDSQDLSQLRGIDENEELQRYFNSSPSSPPSPMSQNTDNAIPFKRGAALSAYYSNFM